MPTHLLTLASNLATPTCSSVVARALRIVRPKLNCHTFCKYLRFQLTYQDGFGCFWKSTKTPESCEGINF